MMTSVDVQERETRLYTRVSLSQHRKWMVISSCLTYVRRFHSNKIFSLKIYEYIDRDADKPVRFATLCISLCVFRLFFGRPKIAKVSPVRQTIHRFFFVCWCPSWLAPIDATCVHRNFFESENLIRTQNLHHLTQKMSFARKHIGARTYHRETKNISPIFMALFTNNLVVSVVHLLRHDPKSEIQDPTTIHANKRTNFAHTFWILRYCQWTIFIYYCLW